MSGASPVRYATNGDVRIAYETFGDSQAGEPLLLIMGLDFQMVWWNDEFCQTLVERGFAVARFDNRDTGLSTHFSSPAAVRPWRAQAGLVPPAYSTLDLVADGLAVLDALGWADAHVLGGSLGGVVAQATGLLHPERVRSVISAMAAPAGSSPLRMLTYLKLGMIVRLARAGGPGSERDPVDDLVGAYRMLASPGAPYDDAWVRRTAELSHLRAPRDPTAVQRQMSVGRGVTLPPLSSLSVPLLVINGEQDPFVKIRAGRATARRVPGSRFVGYPGMAHAIPPALFSSLADDLAAFARASDERRRAERR
jgi:pimeloyl-ACP methyl ester carboxylesterase